MKKTRLLLLALFATFTLMFTSCGLYQMISYPQEIKDQGGEITRDVTAFQYELMTGNEITKKADDTQSYLYLYKKDDTYYWNIRRSQYETKKSFYPQDLTIKVVKIVESETIKNKTSWYCIDEATGDVWTLVILPWSKDPGYFYALNKTDDDRKIVYSVHIKNIITH